ncbi:MAG: GDP-mannose dehydrogenase [Nitrosopumilus sp.]|nr:GDP-mannose dehydrogenase [Nitrosopumilus sp.]MDH3833449.1 GDP-mannose dehydrogenase [Nitrosopumilus sp.]
MTDLILGIGEVGSTLRELLSERGFSCIGIDIKKSREKNLETLNKNPKFLHVCLPGELDKFAETVLEQIKKNQNLKAVIIHSTIKPGTTKSIQDKIEIPVFYSPVRGIHKRFLEDVKRYTKFVACDLEIDKNIKSEIENRFKKVQWMTNTKTAEFAKILVDTTYYGWLINYAQITKMICEKEGIDFDEMWEFSDEIHEYLGNRPKMFPGIIGGHCVIPNLNLIDYEEFDEIRKINELYKKFKEGKY